MPEECRIGALEREVRIAQQRLAVLESSVRRTARLYRVALVGTIAAAAIAIAGVRALQAQGQTSGPMTVRAPFSVVNAGGSPILTVAADGLVTVTANGKPVVSMGAVEQSRGMQVRDRVGRVVAFMGVTGSEKAPNGVFVFNASETPVAGVFVNSDEGGYVYASDDAGRGQAELAFKEGFAGFSLYGDVGDEALIRLGRFAKGNHALKIANGAGTVLVALGETLEGSGGGLSLRDDSGLEAISAGNSVGEGGQLVAKSAAGGIAGLAAKGPLASVFAGPPESPAAKLGLNEKRPDAGLLELGVGGASAVRAGFNGTEGVVVVYGEGKQMQVLKPGIKIPFFGQ